MDSDYFNLVYAKFYARFIPFVVGIFMGCSLVERERHLRSDKVDRLSALDVVHCVCALVSCVGCIVPLYFLRVADNANVPWILDLLYSTFFPVFWSYFLAVFTLMAFTRKIAMVTHFFEVSFFGPLGKLGLTVYLVHPIVLMVRLFGLQRFLSYSQEFIVSQFISVAVISYAIAFFTFVIVERPLAMIVKRFIS